MCYEQWLIAIIQKMRNSNRNSRQSIYFDSEQASTTLSQEMLRRFRNAEKYRKQKVLKVNMNNCYGRNYPIHYKPQYGFKEKWQGDLPNAMEEQPFEDIHPLQAAFYILLLVANCLTVWTLTFQRYFRTEMVTDTVHIYGVGVAVQVGEIVRKGVLTRLRQDTELEISDYVRLFYREIVLCSYFLYLEISGTHFTTLDYLLEFIIYYFLWNKAASIYKRFRLSEEILAFQNQFKIADLLLNILMQAHTFALLLYSASRLDPQNTWINSVPAHSSGVLDTYIYSFYFACTTMLTIGYGDLSPKNTREVAVVILIEIVGVISFGYLLNEMGHTLSKMRQEQETLERDIGNVGKMGKFYKLDKTLENRAKNYLISNQRMANQLKPEEENRLLLKLNDQLRSEIVSQNSLNVLKSCIFFLCHWSRKFQHQVAQRLEKRTIAPDERLQQLSGQQKLYIIKQGEVNVFMNRQQNSKYKKLIRSIAVKPQTEVSENVYGYTRIFSNRVVRLQAFAKQFTYAYFITRSNFMECVEMNETDSQYYHQIKSRIDQSNFAEEWEAPSIKNIKQHFMPSRIFVIKKHRKELGRLQQVRRPARRRRQTVKHQLNIGFMVLKGSIKNSSEKTIEFGMKIADPTHPDCLNKEKGPVFGSLVMADRDEISQVKETYSSESFGDSDPYSAPSNSNDLMEETLNRAVEFLRYTNNAHGQDEKDNKKTISEAFEKHKEYYNFFPLNNISQVLHKLQTENALERDLGPAQ